MIDNRCIEAFLAVVNTRSISRAAEYLYVSQSSISKWIHLLEQEVGAELIVRHKGYRNVELTAGGKELIPLAEEWVSLHRQISSIGENTFPGVRITSIDSLNSTRLPAIYRQLLKNIPNLDISVSTNYTAAIYPMVERKQCDVGITLSELYSPNLVVTPFMSEPYCLLVYGGDSGYETEAVRPTDLDIRKNLYLSSGFGYQQWHEYWWQAKPSYMRIDSVSAVKEVFCEDGLWTIVPECVAGHLKNQPHIHTIPLVSPPPLRTCYFVTHKYPRGGCKTVLPQVKELLMSLAGRADTL